MRKVVNVIANDDHTLDLGFNDGSLKRFDVKPYLLRGIFLELQDLSYFKRVRLCFGTVQWPNEQDFGPDTLYLESIPLATPLKQANQHTIVSTTQAA